MRCNPLLALALLASPTVAAAQETPQPPSPAPEKMVCKTVPAVNSRIGRKRVCVSASQAKLDEERSRREADRASPPAGL